MSENMLKMKDLTVRFDVHRTTIYKWIKDEGFPKPTRKLGKPESLWTREGVEKWEQRTQGGKR